MQDSRLSPALSSETAAGTAKGEGEGGPAPVGEPPSEGKSPSIALEMEKENDSTVEDYTLANAERKKAERKLLIKQDAVIIPFAFCLYVSAYLDRSNLGNARLQGLEKDVLDGDDTKYSIALSCFYITYIIFSIPGTLLTKHVNPSNSIAFGALVWSLGAAGQAAAQNPAGLYVCRLFVGVGEAMFGTAMALYFSMWYTRRELAKRVGLFVSAGSLAGAFGGLIAYGVAHMNHPKIAQFRVLFLYEGLPSLLLATLVFFFLPSRPAKSRFLTDEQRALAESRMKSMSSFEAHDGVDWKAAKRAFTDWKTYVIAVMYSCMNLGLGSVGGFLPTIVKGLGYSNADAQLFTVPPYAVALVFMLLLSSYSDHRQTRGMPVASVFCIGLVGWSILLGVEPHNATHGQLHTRYFGCICVVTAGYSAIPLILSWVAANCPAESQRAVGLGALNSIGQCLSIVAAFVFPSNEGPRFVKGITLNIVFQSIGICLALGMSAYFRAENNRRDDVEGEPEPGRVLNTQEEYDLAKGFRYVP